MVLRKVLARPRSIYSEYPLGRKPRSRSEFLEEIS